MVHSQRVHSVGERENKLTALYKSTFPAVARFVSKRGGSFEEAKDTFHDALLIWYEKSVEPDFAVSRSESAYIFGIAKFLWYRNFAEQQKPGSLAADMEVYGALELDSKQSISSMRLLALVESAGRRCLEMLRSLYYDKLSLSDLAASLGFKSVHSASVQKYKCLEKVRETVKEKSLRYEDFFD